MFAITHSNTVSCVSRGLQKDVLAALTMQKHIDIVPNGIPLLNATFQENSPKTPFTFLFVGALIVQKGIFDLLEAFGMFQKESPHSRLIIIGTGPAENNLKRLSAECSIKNILFLGRQPHEEVLRHMSLSHCLILPSHKEGFGRVLIEMMQFGKPVISTYSGGPEYIVNNDAGLLVSPKDPRALCEAMSSLHRSYSRYDPIIIRRYIEKEYDIRLQTDKLIDIIENR